MGGRSSDVDRHPPTAAAAPPPPPPVGRGCFAVEGLPRAAFPLEFADDDVDALDEALLELLSLLLSLESDEEALLVLAEEDDRDMVFVTPLKRRFQ